ESLRNGDVVNEDKINELPEDLLLHILSFLPTKSVVATSVLSKRWRHVWKMVQNLKFDSENHNTFTEDVYRLLMLHKAPFLETYHLEIRNSYDAIDVGILVGVAFARHVRNLVLDLDDLATSAVKFPSVYCIYDNNTLETLKLNNSIILDFPSRVCLNSLRKLQLHSVRFRNEESVRNLLCGCPGLEELVVHERYQTFGKAFTIEVPSLQRLTIEEDYYFGGGGGGYVINAPSLKYLNIKILYGIEFCLIEKAPELVEAKVSEVSDINNENILDSLTSAKRLSLNLSHLEWWDLLSFMLDGSPKLQVLKIIDLSMSTNNGTKIGRKWNKPKCVPDCLLFHLETFMWTGYGERRDDKEVATYILRHTRRLKKAIFSTKPIEPENLKKLKKRHEVLNELATVGRASNSYDFVFEST
ncbi:hypothetical protein CARUB_v10027829mg, partial [Capsella rubella]